MIENRVVFVLGAGASYSYGFPTARELKTQICKKKIKKEDQRIRNSFDGVMELLRKRRGMIKGPYRWDTAKTFADDLGTSAISSVDAFLEQRRDYEELGKIFIALNLIPKESEENLFDYANDGWYEWLFQNMISREDRMLVEDRVKVITFNYDRSFEEFFRRGIGSTFSPDKTNPLEVLRSTIEVVHAYGELGRLGYNTDNTRKFEPDIMNPHKVMNAVENISLIYEERTQGKKGNFRNILDWSDRVCFLGFGYHKDNIELLGIDEVDLSQDLVYGTTYGMTNNRRVEVEQFFNNNVNDGSELRKVKCLKMLQSTPNLVR